MSKVKLLELRQENGNILLIDPKLITKVVETKKGKKINLVKDHFNMIDNASFEKVLKHIKKDLGEYQ